MKIIIVILILCIWSCKPRTLLVLKPNGDREDGAICHIVLGNGDVFNSKIKNGIAVFGMGTWEDLGEWISIKVDKNGKVVYDRVHRSVDSRTLIIRIH